MIIVANKMVFVSESELVLRHALLYEGEERQLRTSQKSVAGAF